MQVIQLTAEHTTDKAGAPIIDINGLPRLGAALYPYQVRWLALQLNEIANDADQGAAALSACVDVAGDRFEAPIAGWGAHVPDAVFEAEFMTWWEEHGQYCRSGGGDYERTFAFQAWRHLYPQLMEARAALAPSTLAPGANAVGSLPPFAAKVVSKLRRFYDCAEDFESGGVDIGRHWLDLLTRLGLLNRVQRSPALWEISQQGEDLLEIPAAQAGQAPDEFAFEYHHPNGERHTVRVSREQVLEQMPDFIFEALCDKFCNCQPIGETNVVECRCDEYAEEFQLVAAAPAQGGE